MAVRVLVIEDDEVSREVLGVLLEGAGYVVEAVDSGEAALESLEAVRPGPEVVLADQQMPGVAGVELARRMREVCGDAVLLAMSASRPVDGAEGAWDGFLLKPFAMEEFAEAFAGVRKTWDGGRPGGAVLDETVYAKLRVAMRPDKLEQMYAMCVADAERRVEKMRRAASEGDEGTYRREAHAVRGGCGMAGAREMQTLAGGMEEQGLSGDYVASLRELLLACERLKGMLVGHEVQQKQSIDSSGEEAR